MANPEPGKGGNGFTIAHPLLGTLALSGRDVLLAAVLLALGSGAVAVQWITLRAFQDALGRDVAKVFLEVDRAQADRAELLAAIRARTCGEAIAVPRRGDQP